MRKLLTLLTLTTMAACLLAGCGDEPGQPAKTTVPNRPSDTVGGNVSQDPIKGSAAVREALKTNDLYREKIEALEPKPAQVQPEAAPTTAAGVTTPAPTGDTPVPAPAADAPAPAPAGDAPATDAPAPTDAAPAPTADAPAADAPAAAPAPTE